MSSREQFEAHYDDWSGMVAGTAKSRRMKETYSEPKTSAAWVHWQASREAVVVELPDTPNRGIGYGLFDAGKEACRESIEAAGLKVAP